MGIGSAYLESGGNMRILPLLLVTFSAVFSQPRVDFDTTVTFRILLQDSIFIPPIGAFIYSRMYMTASCPAFYHGDFEDSREPRHIEKIPSVAGFLIDYSGDCAGIPTGHKADTTFTFHDRQYKVRAGSGDVYMKVTGITKAFEVSLKFSSNPFPSSLRTRNDAQGRKPLAGRAGRDFQGMQVRDPKHKDWRRMDGRLRREW
jgi:hypothetical protein